MNPYFVVTAPNLTHAHRLPPPEVLDSHEAHLEKLHCALEEQLFDGDVSVIFSQHLLPAEPGVYCFYYQGDLVYIGSADKLRARLAEHRRTIEEATKIRRHEVTYRIVPCGRHLAKSLESRLIEFHQPAWNSTGFGSKAVGSGRAGQKPSQWDVTFGRTPKRRPAPHRRSPIAHPRRQMSLFARWEE